MKKTIFLLFIFIIGLFQANATIKIPQQPDPPHLVNDFAGMLNSSEQSILENKLEQFVDSTSNRIVIVIVNSFVGYEPVEYATQLGREWQLGEKKKNNGIVLLISKSEHKIFIAVGTGLQGALPDGVCEMIIAHEIKPSFKQSEYFDGLDKGTTAIMKATKGEYKADATNNKKGIPLFVIILIIVIILMIIGSIGNRSGGTMIGGGGFGNGMLLGGLMGGGFNSGGSGSSGSSGFGGFGGGGGFDGGGAGGSW